MLCRLALALVSGLALAAPSLADDNPQPRPPTPIHDPPLRQADWKLVAEGFQPKRASANRIFYARTPEQTTAWKPRLRKTAQTVKALQQDYSHYGLLAVFATSGYLVVDGVFLPEDGALRVQVRASPPFFCVPGASCPMPVLSSHYVLIAIRKDSLPAPVKRLYITEVS